MCDAAHSADVTEPQLLEWNFTPKTVEVTTQAQLVTVTFRVTDDIPGTEPPLVAANSIDTTQSTASRMCSSFLVMHLMGYGRRS